MGLAAGQEVELAIEVHPLALSVPLRVLRPDGTPVADQFASFGFGLRSPTSNTSLNLDARGVGTHEFETPGLWAVNVRFRDSPLHSFPVYEEPYYQVQALLPVSPAVALPDPLSLKGSRRERGSLRVELKDIHGKPGRGSVMFLTEFGTDRQTDQGASTDAQGVVRFADLAHGRYTLHGSIDGLKPPLMPGTEPMPGPDALRDQAAFANETVEVEAGVERHVVLQPKPVGYVRGTLRLPPGRSVADYGVFPLTDRQGLEVRHRLDARTGEFVAGPFLAGKVSLRVFRKLEDPRSSQFRDETVEVAAGTVTRVELRPPQEPAPATAAEGTGQVMLGMGGLSFLNEVPRGTGGTAWLDDGKTPAFGACGMLMAPGLPQPVASAVSDAAGQLTWRGRWVSAQAKPLDGAPAPKPKAVVWLPGRCGAAVVEIEPGKPFRAVLPAPLEARGTVTLGGRPRRRCQRKAANRRGPPGTGRPRRRLEPGDDRGCQRPLHPPRHHARPLPGPGRTRRHLAVERA